MQMQLSGLSSPAPLCMQMPARAPSWAVTHQKEYLEHVAAGPLTEPGGLNQP